MYLSMYHTLELKIRLTMGEMNSSSDLACESVNLAAFLPLNTFRIPSLKRLSFECICLCGGAHSAQIAECIALGRERLDAEPVPQVTMGLCNIFPDCL